MRVRGLLDRFRVKVVGFKVQGLGKTRANTTGKLHVRTYSLPTVTKILKWVIEPYFAKRSSNQPQLYTPQRKTLILNSKP